MAKFRPEKRKSPCAECPFRRSSIKGYLGADDPEHFLGLTTRDADMPCHMDIDYSDPDWRETQEPDAPLCVGGLQFQNNTHKLARPADMAEAQRVVGTNDNVFATPEEFLIHHMVDTRHAVRIPIMSGLNWRGFKVNEAAGYYAPIVRVESWFTPEWERVLAVAFDANEGLLVCRPQKTLRNAEDELGEKVYSWITSGGPTTSREMSEEEYDELMTVRAR